MTDSADTNALQAGAETRVTRAMEDYLKAAYRLEDLGGAVTTQRLAEELGLSGPSITNMIKRLDDLNLLVHTPYHGVQLTVSGRLVALEVIRHHRLLELYLSEALGYDLDEVHQEAERLEHHVSEELESRMERVLGYPRFDPHGDPIPSREGDVPSLDDRKLSDIPSDQSWRVTRVSDRDPEKLRYLAGLGFRPGVVVKLVERMPFEGPISVRIEDEVSTLPPAIAQLVRVELVR